MTHGRDIPIEASKRLPCEPGTCYLSRAHGALFALFTEHDAGAIVALDNDEHAFGPVLDGAVARTREEAENGIEFGTWTAIKNGRVEVVENVNIVIAAIRYMATHLGTMRMRGECAVPDAPPTGARAVHSGRRLIALARERGTQLHGARELRCRHTRCARSS